MDNDIARNEADEYTLTITADGYVSTDPYFLKNDLYLGTYYTIVDCYYQEKGGKPLRYESEGKGHRRTQRVSNKALAYLFLKKFDDGISALTKEERLEFPICQCSPTFMRPGIYDSEEELMRVLKVSKPYYGIVKSPYENPKHFIYALSAFDTLNFLEECLKRWGGPGDKAVIKYRIKDRGKLQAELAKKGIKLMDVDSIKDYPNVVEEAKNVIFRGAPGTGKSYLAKQIASYLVSEKRTTGEDGLTDEEKSRIEFVQFHPSFDYTDFVEGLRPKLIENENDVKTLGFELQPGIFKAFVKRARGDSEKSYVFIIDEINRGEISKIFGELFFAIDPEYRGPKGAVSTQYANLHDATEGKFYIPENVFIIGTMNDIDRSVDTFDFAMRRRFRFIKLRAKDRTGMLDSLPEDKRIEAVKRMTKLNEAIDRIDELSSDYHIGPAYFLKLKSGNLTFEKLWSDHIKPLLNDYVRGMYSEKEIIGKLEDAYNLKGDRGGDTPQEDVVA